MPSLPWPSAAADGGRLSALVSLISLEWDEGAPYNSRIRKSYAKRPCLVVFRRSML